MFTGMIQAVGQVVERDSRRLSVHAPENAWEDAWKVGESVAVNGVCLTAVQVTPNLAFEISEETARRTTLGSLLPGSFVNLERALRPIDRMGGHIVQGHVDGIGTLLNVTPHEGDWVFRFGAPEGCDRYLVDKGSVAVEGISLTVVRPSAGAFDAWIVPHTYQHTTLSKLELDSPVNFEFDVLIKYVERLVR